MTVSFHLQQPALRRRASLKSMHPSARKATALSSLPLLMIPLPPALPTNHHGSVLRRRKPFCGSSALSASSTTVSPSLKRSWCCGCRTSSCNSICRQSRHERGETWVLSGHGRGRLACLLRTDWAVGQGIGNASRSFQLCWLIDKAGEEGQDRFLVQTWNLFSTGQHTVW